MNIHGSFFEVILAQLFFVILFVHSGAQIATAFSTSQYSPVAPRLNQPRRRRCTERLKYLRQSSTCARFNLKKAIFPPEWEEAWQDLMQSKRNRWGADGNSWKKEHRGARSWLLLLLLLLLLWCSTSWSQNMGRTSSLVWTGFVARLPKEVGEVDRRRAKFYGEKLSRVPCPARCRRCAWRRRQRACWTKI